MLTGRSMVPAGCAWDGHTKHNAAAIAPTIEYFTFATRSVTRSNRTSIMRQLITHGRQIVAVRLVVKNDLKRGRWSYGRSRLPELAKKSAYQITRSSRYDAVCVLNGSNI